MNNLSIVPQDRKVGVFSDTGCSLKSRNLIHGSPSKQKPGIDMGLPRNDLWRSLLLNAVKLRHTWETHKDLGRKAELKWTKTEQNEERLPRLSDSHNPSDRREVDGTTQLQITASFYEKRKITPGVEPEAQKAKLTNQGESVSTGDYFQALKPNGICPVGLLNCSQPVSTFHLPFPLIWNGNVSNWYSIPVPPLYFLLSSFISPQIDRNLTPG